MALFTMQKIQEHTSRKRSFRSKAHTINFPDADILSEHKVFDKHCHLTSIAISGLSENTISDWQIRVHTKVGIGMSRTSFYKYRWMAEMKIIDRNYYERLREQFISTGKLPEECKAALNDKELFTAKGTQMRQNKELLPLFLILLDD